MNLKTIAIALCFFSIATSGQAQAQSERLDPREVAEIIKRVVDQTDPQIVQSLQAGVEAAVREPSEGFKKMSGSDEIEATFLTCAMGEGAIMIKLTAGVCISNEGRVYTLDGLGNGLSIGAKASLVMGFVKSKNGLVRGTYSALAAGGAYKILQYGNLLRQLAAYNVGLGGNIIIGNTVKSQIEPEERTLVLAGPSLGAMIDVSLSAIQLN